MSTNPKRTKSTYPSYRTKPREETLAHHRRWHRWRTCPVAFQRSSLAVLPHVTTVEEGYPERAPPPVRYAVYPWIATVIQG